MPKPEPPHTAATDEGTEGRSGPGLGPAGAERGGRDRGPRAGAAGHARLDPPPSPSPPGCSWPRPSPRPTGSSGGRSGRPVSGPSRPTGSRRRRPPSKRTRPTPPTWRCPPWSGWCAAAGTPPPPSTRCPRRAASATASCCTSSPPPSRNRGSRPRRFQTANAQLREELGAEIARLPRGAGGHDRAGGTVHQGDAAVGDRPAARGENRRLGAGPRPCCPSTRC